jgi:hypothetical protein
VGWQPSIPVCRRAGSNPFCLQSFHHAVWALGNNTGGEGRFLASLIKRFWMEKDGDLLPITFLEHVWDLVLEAKTSYFPSVFCLFEGA